MSHLPDKTEEEKKKLGGREGQSSGGVKIRWDTGHKAQNQPNLGQGLDSRLFAVISCGVVTLWLQATRFPIPRLPLVDMSPEAFVFLLFPIPRIGFGFILIKILERA